MPCALRLGVAWKKGTSQGYCCFNLFIIYHLFFIPFRNFILINICSFMLIKKYKFSTITDYIIFLYNSYHKQHIIMFNKVILEA